MSLRKLCAKLTAVQVITPDQQRYLEFLLAMTEKEIKVRYKFAVLGFLWILLNPLFQMIIIGFVFQFFVPVKVDNYFLFLFTGLLAWNFFSMTVSKNTAMIVNERALIQKAKFPREVIVLSIVLSNLFHFFVAFVLLLFVLIVDKIVFDQYTILQLISYLARLLLSLPVILWLSCLTAGLSLLTSALNVKYRDINFFVQAIMPLWFYATPIVYTVDLLPAALHPLFYLNPMSAITESFHAVLLNQSATPLYYLLWSIVSGAVICIAGWMYFQKEQKYFDDWV